jgi:hypothetical protein
MNKFKVGDRVRAVKRCSEGTFKKGWIGTVTEVDGTTCNVIFDNQKDCCAYFDEIELIEAEPKPFPTEDEFITWVQNLNGNWMLHNIYNYFAQFQYEKTVEVPLELGKIYEFSSDKKNWEKRMLHGYSAIMHGETKYYPIIRPIQPSRLEQLKEKHPYLTNDEKTELLDILLTQTKEQ